MLFIMKFIGIPLTVLGLFLLFVFLLEIIENFIRLLLRGFKEQVLREKLKKSSMYSGGCILGLCAIYLLAQISTRPQDINSVISGQELDDFQLYYVSNMFRNISDYHMQDKEKGVKSLLKNYEYRPSITKSYAYFYPVYEENEAWLRFQMINNNSNEMQWISVSSNNRVEQLSRGKFFYVESDENLYEQLMSIIREENP